MSADFREKQVERIKHGLIVSCQAHGDHPLRNTGIIASLSVCAERGGAAGIRADGPQDIKAVQASVSLPIVGIYKVPISEARFFITPTFEHAREVVGAGAGVVALEATFENRPDEKDLKDFVEGIQERLRVPVMADVSTYEEGVRAWESGADLVATTLSGYTRESPPREGPDFELVSRLAESGIRVVAEGRVRTPEQTRELFDRGSHSVVVGTAITDPVAIISRFASAARRET